MTAAITLAIPYYSGRDYLVRAIRSVLAQQGVEWQAVVCDDGPDHTVEALVREAGEGRVRYLRNPQNLGMAGNWNRCIEVAETDLVTLLHGDDELLPAYGEAMVTALARHPRAVAAFCDYDAIGPSSEHLFSLTDHVKKLINPARRTEAVLAGEPGMRALLRANFIAAPSLCYRKSLLRDRRFDGSFKFVLDWEMTTRFLLDGDEIVGIPTLGLHYRRHDQQATEQLTRGNLRFREEIDFYERMRLLVEERGWKHCADIARHKYLTKLHIMYRMLRSAARGELGNARNGIALLRERRA